MMKSQQQLQLLSSSSSSSSKLLLLLFMMMMMLMTMRNLSTIITTSAFMIQQQQQQQRIQLPSTVVARTTTTTRKRKSFLLTTNNMVAIDTSDIKNGLTIEIDGDPYKVLQFSVMKQARGAAKMTIKFKNLIKGTTIENTYRSGEKFQTALIERKKAQYTYQDENNFFFMDSITFEEMTVSSKVVNDCSKWLTEGSEVELISFKDKIIEVIVPSPSIYEIIETEPNVKGNTAQGYTKPATLDCGAVINVPGFIETGQKIRVDTEKGEYMERINT